MDYAQLGRSGLRVSRLCLGTMNMGKHVDERTSFALLDAALDAGINFIDTADVYGGVGFRGRTEEFIGRWLRQGGGRREKVVLATKVYGKMGDGPNERGLSAYHIRHACEESLRRLQTDHVDLYQMHHVDRTTPWEEVWQEMGRLQQSGKVVYTGSSNFAAWNLVQAQHAARERGLQGLISEQSLYNLTNRMVELEVLPACASLGIGVIPWSPLAEGLLAGILGRPEGTRRNTEAVQKRLGRFRGQVERYESFCAGAGKSPEAVAVAWLLKNPVVSSVIIGPRTPGHLEGMVKALETDLREDELSALDEIWPGPGGEAPEAYAW
jgi:aryl-alcohol dehydrogenase-like predicted oxidoreductase